MLWDLSWQLFCSYEKSIENHAVFLLECHGKAELMNRGLWVSGLFRDEAELTSYQCLVHCCPKGRQIRNQVLFCWESSIACGLHMPYLLSGKSVLHL
eukprot:971309-Amphidinium_carterae.1